MIPLFKSHYSIGRSILTLEEATGKHRDRSIFYLAQEGGLKDVVLVEDSLIGFLRARQGAEEYGLNLRFGLRLSISNHPNEEEECRHKVIIFAKDSEGCKKLNQIYSNAFVKNGGVAEENFLREAWSDKHLKLAIPFYDSFIFNNTMLFASCTPDLSFTKPTFFIEDNGLPFDDLISEEVELYCERNKLLTEEVKSIFYNKQEDFSAYQSYKCICNRGFKARTLQVPNFDHQGSDQFSFESWRTSCV